MLTYLQLPSFGSVILTKIWRGNNFFMLSHNWSLSLWPSLVSVGEKKNITYLLLSCSLCTYYNWMHYARAYFQRVINWSHTPTLDIHQWKLLFKRETARLCHSFGQWVAKWLTVSIRICKIINVFLFLFSHIHETKIPNWKRQLRKYKALCRIQSN